LEPLQLLLDDLLGVLLATDRARRGHESLQEGERVPGARGDLGVEPVRVQGPSLNGRMSRPKTA
jgi:hypothetical protein